MDPSTLVLGIDAGGTKTVCLLADGSGNVLNAARSGGANLQAVGELELEKTLHAVMDEAVGDRAAAPAAICLGIAGVDREEDAALVRGIMKRIGFKMKVTVTNDALVALVAGAGHQPGIVIIAGTGSIAYGRSRRGEAARAGGWGYVLGDEGSGYWLGRFALQSVVRQSDGRGPATLLTPLVLSHFGVARVKDLVHEVYYRRLAPSAIASVAKHVQAAFEAGDRVAAALLEQGANELVACALSVADRLEMRYDEFTFVLAGGIFHAVPWLARELRDRLPKEASHSEVAVLEREPAYGAVLIALADLEGRDVVPAYLSD